MAVLEGGVSASLAEVGAAASMPLHVVTKPTPYGALGSYRVSGISGTMAAGLGAAAEIFQFRWTDATRFAIIENVQLDTAYDLTTGFTAGTARIMLMRAEGWSADGSGGASLLPATDKNTLRSNMGNTLVNAVRIATTAALTAGTKTLDTNPIGQVFSVIPVTANVALFGFLPISLLDQGVSGPVHPLHLAVNEGFAITATVPATGTWVFGITVRWSEVTAF